MGKFRESLAGGCQPAKQIKLGRVLKGLTVAFAIRGKKFFHAQFAI